MAELNPDLERRLENEADGFARRMEFHESLVRELGLLSHFTDHHWTVRWISVALLHLLDHDAERYLGRPVDVIRSDSTPLVHPKYRDVFLANQEARVVLKADKSFLPDVCVKLLVPPGNRHEPRPGEYFAHIRSIPLFGDDLPLSYGTLTVFTLMRTAAFLKPIDSSEKDFSDSTPIN